MASLHNKYDTEHDLYAQQQVAVWNGWPVLRSMIPSAKNRKLNLYRALISYRNGPCQCRAKTQLIYVHMHDNEAILADYYELTKEGLSFTIGGMLSLVSPIQLQVNIP